MDTNPTQPHETLQDMVEIRSENEITIPAAMQLAQDASLQLGLSTLQRWAKLWAQQGASAKVKAVLVTTRQGKLYKLDRLDFESWIFDQKQNARPLEAPQDLARSHDVSQDPAKPRETSRDAARPREISQDEDRAERLRELESENMNLKIDIGVRKQLLDRAKEEMDGLRAMTNNLLRENGALAYQIHQLAPPSARQTEREATPASDHRVIDTSIPPAVDNSERSTTTGL